jgi:TPR repeat protein
VFNSVARGLGVRYDEGQGVPQDKSKAVHWYAAAAAQGHVRAQYCLGKLVFAVTVARATGNVEIFVVSAGVCYAEGEGVTPDESKAVLWYKAAAAQGFVRAQYNLGMSYPANGSCLALSRMQRICRPSAGVRYDEGRGVPQDKSKAVELYAAAASQGHVRAQYYLGKFVLQSVVVSLV